jgi:hypothetical protein
LKAAAKTLRRPDVSRFEHAFHLALGPQPVNAKALWDLYGELVARTPEISSGDPWRLGLLVAERDFLTGQVLELEYAADPTENMDMSIGWLLLAAHAPDKDPHIATLAAGRLADRLELRFARRPPRGLRYVQVQEASAEWRCWTGLPDSDTGMAA